MIYSDNRQEVFSPNLLFTHVKQSWDLHAYMRHLPSSSIGQQIEFKELKLKMKSAKYKYNTYIAGVKKS
jgi:hypothetical protein